MGEHVFSEPTKWFIVFPSNDKEEVQKRVIDELKSKNITCVYNGNGYNSDTDVKKIKKIMNSCQKILVILTKNSKQDTTNAWFRSLNMSNITKEVVFIWLNLKDAQEAEELKKIYTVYGDHRMFELTPDFDWFDIEEISSVFVGQVWSHFTGYTRIVLPLLEDRIKQSEWYKKNPYRFPLKEFYLIPESAITKMKNLKDYIQYEGELLPIKYDRGSYAEREYKAKVYSITKNNEKYYFVGTIPEALGILRILEEGTDILQERVFPRISADERLRQVKKFAVLLEQLINHPDNSACNNRAKVLPFSDASTLSDLLLETIKETLNEERDGIKGDRMPGNSMEKIEARNVYQGLAWAYIIKYLGNAIDEHVKILKELQQYEPDKKVFDKLIIVVPNSAAIRSLTMLDRTTDGKQLDSFKQDRPIILQHREGRDYQLVLYTLRKADKEYIVAAEYPNPIICLKQMNEMKAISGLSNLSTEADKFVKLLGKLIECSTVAGKVHLLFYDELAGKHIDEAVFEVVENRKRFSLKRINDFIQSKRNILYSTELSKGDLVEIKRYGVYSHWGVYDEKNYIYHLTGGIRKKGLALQNVIRIKGEDFITCKVARDPLEDVAKGCKAVKNNSKDRFYIPSDPDIIIERAKSIMRKQYVEYSISTSNCEHFATYCRYVDSSSTQADKMVPKALTVLSITGMLVLACVWKYKATPSQLKSFICKKMHGLHAQK